MDPQNTQQKEQEQQQSQENQLTPELAQELATLVQDPKLQVRYGALNAILQYTQNEQAKQMFADTQIFKTILQYIDIPEMTKICLSTMIHFSSSENYAEKLVDYVYPVIMKMRNDSGLVQELGLLLLLNVSKQAQFTEKIFAKHQEGAQNPSKLSPFVLDIIFGWMESKPTRKWVIANIFVNISSHEVGREYIANEKLYLGFIKYINEESDSLRLAVLRIMRNVAFLWENQQIITDLLAKENEVIDRIAIHIAVMIVKSNLVHDVKPCKQLLMESGYRDVVNFQKQIQPHFQKMKTNEQKSLNQVEICIDFILILSNSGFPERKPVFHMQELKKLIAQINFTKISEQTKDKLEALETFCFW